MTLVVNINDTTKYDIYVGRTSKWGNPYSHILNSNAKFIVDSRDEAINAFKYYILFENTKLFFEAKEELKQKILGCHCVPLDCHAYFLSEISNSDKDINYYRNSLLNDNT